LKVLRFMGDFTIKVLLPFAADEFSENVDPLRHEEAANVQEEDFRCTQADSGLSA